MAELGKHTSPWFLQSLLALAVSCLAVAPLTTPVSASRESSPVHFPPWTPDFSSVCVSLVSVSLSEVGIEQFFSGQSLPGV